MQLSFREKIFWRETSIDGHQTLRVLKLLYKLLLHPVLLDILTIFQGHLCSDLGRFLAVKMPAQGCKLEELTISNFCGRCHVFLKMDFAQNLRCLDLFIEQDEYLGEVETLLLDSRQLTEICIESPSFSSNFFSYVGHLAPPHPLETLVLCAGDGPTAEWSWSARDIVLAIEAGGLSNLRQFHVDEVVHDYCNHMAELQGENDIDDDYLQDLINAMTKCEDQRAKNVGEGYRRKHVGVMII